MADSNVPCDLGSITHAEQPGSPTEGFDDEGNFTAERRVRVAWADRFNLAEKYRGYSKAVGTAGDRIFVQPHRDPDFARAVVLTVGMEPFTNVVLARQGDTRFAAYTEAELVLNYGIPPFGTGANEAEVMDLASESLDFAAEFITVPEKNLFWASDGTDRLLEGQAPGKVLKTMEWVYTQYYVPTIPALAVALIGKVNSTAMTSSRLGMTFDVETLLFNPPAVSRNITSEGVGAWQLTYRFSYKPWGWNKFFKGGHGTVAGANLILDAQTIYDDNGKIVKFYEPASFTGITGA